jgi:class 3 adenylate cyclase/predicted ATPase
MIASHLDQGPIASEWTPPVKFSEIVEATTALLEQKGRISYRGLAREFDLDDATLDDLKEELIQAARVAVDENGKVLVWAGGGARPAPVSAPSPQGERRQLTVMFCDLVGSTALSERLDPEDLHALVNAYQDSCRTIIDRYEGYIAQYLGDGILVYFGYPAAHEDDAVRAVQAGLDILQEVGALATEPPVQVRIGIHTGPVVIGAIGEGARVEQLALGETPNIAARVQGSADAHTLAVSRDTYRLVQGIFECDDLGPRTLKGITRPLTLYRVSGRGRAKTRFDVSLQQGLTPFTGRDAELALLLERWRRARRGAGQLVMLSGEAGMGKSRLAEELFERTRADDVLRMDFRCSPFFQNSALYPVIDELHRVLSAAGNGGAETRRSRLVALLQPAGMADDESVALFAALLSIQPPEGADALKALSARERKIKTLQALANWIQRRAAIQPMQVVFEDLHWADPSTIELLGQVIGQIPAARILLLLLSRPEFVPPWRAQDVGLVLQLDRLTEQDIVRVASRVAGKRLPPGVVEQLVRKTDGVPLYVEEMTKDLLESNLLDETADGYELAGPLPSMAVPFSLQDSLASRLDRLGPVRRLAQIGAVLGREFSFELMHAVSGSAEDALAQGLQQLCDAGILFPGGDPSARVYSFKHALLQDAAYHSLLNKQRQQSHEKVARALESGWPETVDAHPELVAHHYTEAGQPTQALPYWQRAGQQAVQSSNNKEAVAYLSKALEVLKTLPASTERDRRELELHLALGVPLTVTTSWAAPEVEQAYARALQLCEVLGESKQLFPAMYGVWSYHQVRADYAAALPVAQQLLALAQRAEDNGFLLQAHRASGIILLHMGDFDSALEHCEAGYALYDPDRHHAHVTMYWMDPGVGCLCYGAWALWCLGYPDKSLEEVYRALALAQRHGHAFSLAYALHFSAVLHQLRREAAPTRRQAEALLELSNRQGFPVFREWGSLLLGCAFAEQGRAAEGSTLIREAQHAIRAAGASVARSASLAVLARVYEQAGETEAGLATVAQAMDFVAQSQERYYEAELHRLRGALVLQQGRIEEALRCFEQALALARRQEARSWALRAATDLARLLQQRGQAAKGRAALGAVYDSFTEGFETADLRDAKALLQDLA